MTKARTLADYVPFDSTGVLTSASSLDATKLSGSLPELDGSALTNLPAGGVSNLASTTFTTQTWTSVSGNSVKNQDHTSNLAVGKYLVHIRTRGASNADTNGMQVAANATNNHTGITMYSMGDSFGGGQGTRATVSGRYELWDVTAATNSFRSNHANNSMWSSAHQSIPSLSGSITAMRIT